MSPKPAYEELLRLVKGQWWTKTEAKTGADGTARFRGFRGDYRVHLATADGKTSEAAFSLTQHGPNRWVLRLP